MSFQFLRTAALVATVLSASSFAAITPTLGWQNAAVPSAPSGSFTGGMDLLPNGNAAIFDGGAIREVDPATGTVVGTIYVPPVSVFGSFVTVDPTGTYLLFGESTLSTITKVPLNGGPTSVVATITFNFSCAFVGPDVALVAHANGSFTGTEIVRVDVAASTTDVIASLNGPSGPLAVNSQGDVVYGTNTIQFPAPVGGQNVILFTAAQIAAAGGATVLTDLDATIYVPAATAPAGLAFDEEGDLFVSDSVLGNVREFDVGGVLKTTLGSDVFASCGSIVVRGNGTGVAQLGAFQPQDGGELYVLSTDFFSFNDLNVLSPKRPTLGSSPNSPVPTGAFSVDLTGGPANGFCVLFVAVSTLPNEIPADYLGVPYFIGFNPGTIVATATVPLDNNGGFSIPAVNHGTPGAIVVQGACVDSLVGPAGTSNAYTLTLN